MVMPVVRTTSRLEQVLLKLKLGGAFAKGVALLTAQKNSASTSLGLWPSKTPISRFLDISLALSE